MENIKQYIEKNKDRFIEELFELIRIPSISSKPEHKQDMYKMAEAIKESLIKAGADNVRVLETDGNPVTYGEKIIDSSLPTVLVYGHMDVMPVDPIDLWDSPPFEPEIRDGKIFARGADDDKGQLFMHVKAFEFLIKNNSLACNIKFLIEGEEEVGSANLPKFCEKHKDLLKSDIILVSDTSLISYDIPSITTGLRGLSYVEVELTGPNRDLHSGLYGGAVANPINILSQMISNLFDDDNRINIPGFYDDVLELSIEERKEMAEAPFSSEEYKKSIDVDELFGEKSYSTIEHVGIRPSIDVNGIWGGYIGEGAKTIIPSKAFAKISMRLVPNQEPIKIANLFEKHFKSIAPKSVKVKVKYLHGGNAYVSPIDLKAYKAASMAYDESFGKKPLPFRSGGSIPIISTFEKILGTKTILMGFGLDSDAIHSPNENYPLANFYKGIETISLFYKYFTKM